MAKLYKIDGTIQEIEPKSKKKGFQLQELYDLIGCDLVECVNFSAEEIAICDEEGWLKESPQRNEKANDYITSICGDDWDICGNVVICKTEEFK